MCAGPRRRADMGMDPEEKKMIGALSRDCIFEALMCRDVCWTHATWSCMRVLTWLAGRTRAGPLCEGGVIKEAKMNVTTV
jgi:hypothetical protein